ncbi:metallophosphoesterase family protein [Falsiroseomonas sp.]|uniref:metallophosphoesterase family protein n=1 Tax=Falsiroseomonas sp. TaxID=2870721 RepID=UPI003F6E74A5
MSKIVFLSDLHLSPTHGFFWDNFRIACVAANAAGAAGVIVNGDLCINGPDSDAEMDFAARALSRLRGQVLALPGNHDVGDEPPGQDPNQLIDAPRLARWNEAFGSDRFTLDIGAWRLLGVNAQLFGSGLREETEQTAWLAQQLAGAEGRPVALVLHKPLFVESADEAEATASSLNPAPRAALLPMLREGGVRMVISGHLHSSRDRVVEGIRHLWLPALAFLGSASHGGTPAVGAVTVDFSGPEALVAELLLPGAVPHDLAALKGHGRYKFLRDMPPCPPEAERSVLGDAAA